MQLTSNFTSFSCKYFNKRSILTYFKLIDIIYDQVVRYKLKSVDYDSYKLQNVHSKIIGSNLTSIFPSRKWPKTDHRQLTTSNRPVFHLLTSHDWLFCQLFPNRSLTTDRLFQVNKISFFLLPDLRHDHSEPNAKKSKQSLRFYIRMSTQKPNYCFRFFFCFLQKNETDKLDDSWILAKIEKMKSCWNKPKPWKFSKVNERSFPKVWAILMASKS